MDRQELIDRLNGNHSEYTKICYQTEEGAT